MRRRRRRAAQTSEIGTRSRSGRAAVRRFASSRSKRSRFPAREPRKGTVRFNDTAGSMARDSVFNAASVVRAMSGLDPSDFDLHVNVSAAATSTDRRPGLRVLSRALLRADEDAAAAGHRGDGRSCRSRARCARSGEFVEKLYAARQPACAECSFPPRTRARSTRHSTASRSFPRRRRGSAARLAKKRRR